MSLRLRRGTDAQRQTVTFDQGELVYTTDTLKVYVGDGVTAGGNNIGQSLAGNGLYFDTITQTLQCPSAGITSVSSDNSPKLGGNLNLNGHNINGNGSINITGFVASSNWKLDTNAVFTPQSSASQLTINGSLGTLSKMIGITDGTTSNIPLLQLNGSRGTIGSPAALLASDTVSGISFGGYNGLVYATSGGIFSQYTSTANVSNTSLHPSSNVILFASNNTSVVTYTFGSNGVLLSPVLQTTTYNSTTIPSASTVGVGARAFVTDATATTFASVYTGGSTNNVPVYSDGTNWRIG